jgi:hypothetical protein
LVDVEGEGLPRHNGGPAQPRTLTASEEILNRYRHVERAADSRGRIIGVRRVRPSEQSKIVGMTADLGGYDLIPNVEDETKPAVRMSHRMPLMMAASVVEMDGNPIAFPRNRVELDAIYDQLDAEGMEAIVQCATRLGEEMIAETARREAAKNSQGTRTSDLSAGS